MADLPAAERGHEKRGDLVPPTPRFALPQGEGWGEGDDHGAWSFHGQGRQARHDRRVVLGHVTGAYGVRGWVKVRSYTQPSDNILRYTPWWIDGPGGQREYPVVSGRVQGGFIVAQLAGVDVREAAMALAGSAISAPRSRLPQLPPGEYYWTDLIGLKVVNQEGIDFGKVVRLFETGANDVLVVDDGEMERFIPYVFGMYVLAVDLEAGLMRVDWDADF